MRGSEIDRTGSTWFFKPTIHKTSHKGKVRSLGIGPKARAILVKYLEADPVGYCFTPEMSEKERLAIAHAERKTHKDVGNAPGRRWRAPGERKRKRKFGDHYKVAAYRRAIDRAAEKAKVPKWAPNQIRHAAAENIQEAFGIEATRASLGHSNVAMSKHYAKQNMKLVAEVAEAIG